MKRSGSASLMPTQTVQLAQRRASEHAQRSEPERAFKYFYIELSPYGAPVRQAGTKPAESFFRGL